MNERMIVEGFACHFEDFNFTRSSEAQYEKRLAEETMLKCTSTVCGSDQLIKLRLTSWKTMFSLYESCVYHHF